MNDLAITGFVDGKPHVGAGERFDKCDPARARVIGVVHDALQADVDLAVAAAQRGFATWSALTGAERGRILQRAAALLGARNAELAAMEVRDTGKPLQEALVVDVASGADFRIRANHGVSLSVVVNEMSVPEYRSVISTL